MLRRSILFNAVEAVGVPEGVPQALAVFDMAGEVADAGVEDIVEGVLPEEDVADHPHALPNEGVRPESSQVGYGVDDPFLDAHAVQEVLVVDLVPGEKEAHLLVVPLDEADDSLAEVLGYVLGLVFEAALHPASQLALL